MVITPLTYGSALIIVSFQFRPSGSRKNYLPGGPVVAKVSGPVVVTVIGPPRAPGDGLDVRWGNHLGAGIAALGGAPDDGPAASGEPESPGAAAPDGTVEETQPCVPKPVAGDPVAGDNEAVKLVGADDQLLAAGGPKDPGGWVNSELLQPGQFQVAIDTTGVRLRDQSRRRRACWFLLARLLSAGGAGTARPARVLCLPCGHTVHTVTAAYWCSGSTICNYTVCHCPGACSCRGRGTGTSTSCTNWSPRTSSIRLGLAS